MDSCPRILYLFQNEMESIHINFSITYLHALFNIPYFHDHDYFQIHFRELFLLKMKALLCL